MGLFKNTLTNNILKVPGPAQRITIDKTQLWMKRPHIIIYVLGLENTVGFGLTWVVCVAGRSGMRIGREKGQGGARTH